MVSLLLGVAVVVAVGGVAFAAGRLTAPPATAAAGGFRNGAGAGTGGFGAGATGGSGAVGGSGAGAGRGGFGGAGFGGRRRRDHDPGHRDRDLGDRRSP